MKAMTMAIIALASAGTAAGAAYMWKKKYGTGATAKPYAGPQTPNYYQETTPSIRDMLPVLEQSMTTLVPDGSANTVSDPRFMTVLVG